MTSRPRRAVCRLRIGLIALAALAAPLVPAAAVTFAQDALYPGAVGLVANTGGEPVLLRETPSFDAAVLSSFPEGTPVDILEGPVYSPEGTAWHGVSIGGVIGYIVAGYLTPSSGWTEPAPVEMAQEAAAVDATVEAAPVEAAPAVSETPENTVATADLNLRADPSYEAMVLSIVPAGAVLTPTGEWVDNFAGVTFSGQYGWVDSNWLGTSAAPQDAVLAQDAAPVADAAPVTDAALLGDPSAAPAGDVAYAADVVNLRAGPSEGDAVLRVLPAGGAVTVTGASSDGWTPVWYNGTWGFIRADFLSMDAAAPVTLAQEAAPVAAPAAGDPTVESGSSELVATTTSDVNLRGGPDMTAPVLGTLPAGVALTPLAGPEAGFYQVAYGDLAGWVAAEYLEVSASYQQRVDRERRQTEGKVEGSEPAGDAELGAGGIIWPVSGGLWTIMQGYNGSSHQNQDSLWQYEYSLDLARRDGNTAGQQVISPVNGVVTWTDRGSGGISIDIGNGHAVAMFHANFMNGLEAGSVVRQGQYLGEISGPGGPGFAGAPHLQITLWASNDNGNWDRRAVPFTGQYVISGMAFPDIGGGQQYTGTEFRP